MKIWQIGCVVGALAATSFAAVYRVVVSQPTILTPNAKVADAFNVIPLVTRAFRTKAHPVPPAPPMEAASGTRLSANAVVAAEFGAVGSGAEEVTGSLPKGRMLLAAATVDSGPPGNEAGFAQAPAPVLVNPTEPELPYLGDDVYSETPRPRNLARIAAALSDVPLGTPVQEIDRAAEAFGLDARFMKAVAKIESDLNPRQRTGSYIGLFQLSKDEFRDFGSGDILNPRDNAMAAANKFLSEAALFEEVTHKKPTLSDLYLIHQQGWEGAAEHVSHPQQIAWRSMCATQEGMAKGEQWCKRAIWGNTLPAMKREFKSVDRVTSGAFVAMWRRRVETFYTLYEGPKRRRPEV